MGQSIVGGGGTTDTAACYQIIDERGAQLLIPPRVGAVRWPTSAAGAQARNTAIFYEIAIFKVLEVACFHR